MACWEDGMRWSCPKKLKDFSEKATGARKTVPTHWTGHNKAGLDLKEWGAFGKLEVKREVEFDFSNLNPEPSRKLKRFLKTVKHLW